MSVIPVTTEDLRRMWNQEGLIIQGCGGDLNEWVDGINELLEQTGILRNGSKFESVMTFQNGETTCLLFPLMVWMPTSANLPCGGWTRSLNLAAPGSLIMWITGWVDF